MGDTPAVNSLHGAVPGAGIPSAFHAGGGSGVATGWRNWRNWQYTATVELVQTPALARLACRHCWFSGDAPSHRPAALVEAR